MKLSDQTKKLLENYSTINNGIVIRKSPEGTEGTKIRTVDTSKAIFSLATIQETFDKTVVLYDLNQFLSTLSGFTDPEVTLHDTYLTVSQDKSLVKIMYADETTVIQQEKTLTDPEFDATFELSQDILSKVLGFCKILKSSHLRIRAKDGKLVLQALDRKNINTNTFDVDLGPTEAEFDVYLQHDLLKMIPGDYTVSVNKALIAKFTNSTNTSLVYYVAIDKQAVAKR